MSALRCQPVGVRMIPSIRRFGLIPPLFVGTIKLRMNPAWYHRPIRTALRTATTYIRRLHPRTKNAVIPFDAGASRIVAELDTSLGRGLYRYGYEDPDLDLVSRILASGDWFIDGGANVGLFSLVAARRVGSSGRVFAFEPAVATRSRLERNIAINQYDWIESRTEALGEKRGSASFFAFSGNGSGVSSFAPATREGAESQVVPVESIDRAMTDYPGAPLRLVKLDLEGAEMKALRGAVVTLEALGPDLLVEVERAHLERQGSSPEELFSFLTSRGYNAYRIRAEKNSTTLLVSTDESSIGQGSPNFFFSRDPERLRAHGLIP